MVTAVSDAVESLGIGNGSGWAHMEQLAVPHAIQESAFHELLASGREFKRRVDWELGREAKAAIEGQPVAEEDYLDYATPILEGGIAMISAVGALSKYGSYYGGSTIRLRERFRRARKSENITGVLLYMDSPGGTVSGTKEAVDDLRELVAVKPVVGIVEGLCASAMYWIGSACTRILATDTSHVGSIGTYMVVGDFSKMFEEAGVTVHVIREGDFKGAGVTGTEIEDKHLEEWQRLVTGLNKQFLGGVVKGRPLNMAAVKKIADGRVHDAADAMKLGLIDEIGGVDKALKVVQTLASKNKRAARAAGTRGKSKETGTMSKDDNAAPETATADGKGADETTADNTTGSTAKTETAGANAAPPQKPAGDAAQPAPASAKPATLEELKANIPDSTADFREQCLTGGRTLVESLAAHADVLRAKNDAAQENLDTARAASQTPGTTDGVGTEAGKNAGAATDGATGDATAEWNGKMQKLTAYDGGKEMSRQDATLHLSKTEPELYDRYIEEHNAKHNPRRQR